MMQTGYDATLFTRADALAAGLTDRQMETRVRSGVWCALRPGIYVEAAGVDPASLSLRVRAALHRLGPEAAASHLTAAQLRAIATLGPRVADVDVTRPATPGSTPAYLPGVRALRSALPDEHVVSHDGIRQTTTARTVFDVARTSSFRSGVVTADSALHRELVTPEELRRIADDCRRWPGRLKALAVIAFADRRSESALESVSRVAIRDHDLPAPRPQVTLGDTDGPIGRVDFFWDEFNVVGEADGRVKYADGEAEPTDLPPLWEEKLRQERLEEAGFIVVRWTWNQIFFEPEKVVARIRVAFRRSELRRTA